MTVVTQSDLLTYPNYIEESVEGQPPASGAASLVGPILEYLSGDTMDPEIIEALGYDIREIRAGLKYGVTVIEYSLINDGFAKYMTKLPNGTGTPEKSVTLCAKINKGGTAVYRQASFARPRRFILTGAVNMDIIGRAVLNHDLATESTTAPGYTLADDPGASTSPSWDFVNSSVAFDGNTLDVQAIRVTVDWDVLIRGKLGSQSLAVNRVVRRDIFFEVTAAWDDSLALDAEGNLAWTLKSGTSTLTLSGAKILNLPKDFTPRSLEVPLVISGRAKSLNWS